MLYSSERYSKSRVVVDAIERRRQSSSRKEEEVFWSAAGKLAGLGRLWRRGAARGAEEIGSTLRLGSPVLEQSQCDEEGVEEDEVPFWVLVLGIQSTKRVNRRRTIMHRGGGGGGGTGGGGSAVQCSAMQCRPFQFRVEFAAGGSRSEVRTGGLPY